MENKQLIQEIIKANLLNADAAGKILQEAALSRKPAEQLILEQRIIGEESLAALKSRLLKVPYKKVDISLIGDDVLKLIPEETVRNYKVMPLAVQNDILIAGMVNPDDYKAQEALTFIAKQKRMNLGVYLITQGVWEEILRRYSPYRGMIDEAVKSLNLQIAADAGTGTQMVQLEEKMNGTEEGPVIKIVSSTLKEAVWQKASDIHIEPQRNRSRIRFRVDGELRETASLPLALHTLIVSRVKILSNLKIDENRIPQDGRFRTYLFGRDIDYRVATFPTPVGEKVVIRVLDPSTGLKGLTDLGLAGRNLEIAQSGLDKPYGMILITGPTGSGKSTTLYAMMQLLNKEDVNIVSLEDPVEYYMDGLNQSQVKPEIGYDFASGLRQILRQDPDVIMVGEIRDQETAGLAVQAALTGHIVLSTLHTNNSTGVIPRLIDMGVQPFLLPASVNLMLAQRLLPKLCDKCKYQEDAPIEIQRTIKSNLDALPADVRAQIKYAAPYKIYKTKGCDVCKGKGISGRIAMFEVFKMTEGLEKIISKGVQDFAVAEEARAQGMITMRQDGILKALDGYVSIEVVLRETSEM